LWYCIFMNQSIFKAYDVRGLYPQEFDEQAAYRIARATAEFLGAKTMLVAMDERHSSVTIKEAVIAGLEDGGVAEIIDIGAATTPMYYFAAYDAKVDGGIMVTASHNPPQYNGLKIVGRGGVPIYSGSGLKDIQKLLELDNTSKQAGSVEEISVLNQYLNFLVRESSGKNKRIRFVIDASNGVAPVVLKPLLEKLNLDPVLLNFDIDGNFPNHSPDISKKDNLQQLKNKIIETGADLGFAFDGDADRLTVLDEKGDKLPAEFVVGLLFKAQSGLFRKLKVVYDLRFSKSIKELVGKNGFPSPTGYVYVRGKMEEIGADLGGELAGHFDFKEMNYAESAMLAMLRILNIVASSGKTLSALVEPFKKYVNSGEINIEINQNDSLRSKIMENFKNKYSDGKQNFLDGITVEYPEWWFNARFSNTEPLIRIVVEAGTKELMEQKKEELILEIKKAV